MINIATLATASDALDTVAKFTRLMSGAGVTLDQLMRPVNNRTARTNLAAYLAAGCPKVPPTESAIVEKKPTLVLIKTTEQSVIPGKKTNLCLKGKHWSNNRDADIDRWLPKMQCNQLAASVSSYQPQKAAGTTFREMALAALAVAAETPLDQLGTMLKERNFTFTLPSVEDLIERQEGGENVGLRIDGYASFAFLENEDGSVSVLSFNRRDGRWNGRLRSLGDGSGWGAGGRLLLRNSVAQTL